MHSYVIMGTPQAGVWSYCYRCHLRTPTYSWYSGAWAKDLFKKAKKNRTLYLVEMPWLEEKE